MGIYVTGYTEAKVRERWHCIDFWQHDAEGKMRHIPCIAGQSMVAQALELDCDMDRIALPSDISEQVREMCTHKDGSLFGSKFEDGNPWHIVRGRWFEKANLDQPEFCGFFPRNEVAAYLANPDETEISEDDMVSAAEYRHMDEEEKKAYQYFEYTPQWGNRSILRRLKRNVIERMNAWNDMAFQDISLSDIRVLLRIW